MKILLLFSGLDSTVLLHDHLSDGHKVRCVTFNYGQKHSSELRCARAICKKLNAPQDEVELARVKNLFLRCALTDGGSGNIVPNRNGVFLNIAAAMCMSLGFDAVSIGCNRDDRNEFPDCSELYLEGMKTAWRLGGIKAELLMPYANKTKWEIVRRGAELFVPFEETMSCYDGTNCGKCNACKLRKEALCLL